VNSENAETQNKALQEFNNFVEKLRSKGINVITVKDTLEPHTPDSIFPNNWISMHQDGTVVLYPMCAVNRRWERRNDILEILKRNFSVKEIIDLSAPENDGKFLEGTGSMIFDHDNKLAYGSVSLRLDEQFFVNFVKNLVLNLWFFILIKRRIMKIANLSYQCNDVCCRSICSDLSRLYR
jgi:hypothetical protein